MRGTWKIGDKGFAKTDVCSVPLLGEIVEIDGNMCRLKMCGYHRNRSLIPHTIKVRLDQLDPHNDVVQRWESDKKPTMAGSNVRVEIDKLAKQLKEAMKNDKEIIWRR